MKNSSRFSIQEISKIAVMAASISLAVYLFPPIHLSFLPVPVTLQLFLVLLIGLLLPPFAAFFTVVTYLLLGAIGLPVFSGGQGGFGVILGPTGGFLILFPFVAVILSFLKTKFKHYLWWALFQGVAVYLFLYPLAVAWLSWQTQTPYWSTMIGMAPFMAVDFLKIIFATALGKVLNRHPFFQNQVIK